MKLAELFAAPFKGGRPCSCRAEQNIKSGPIVKASVPYCGASELKHLVLYYG